MKADQSGYKTIIMIKTLEPLVSYSEVIYTCSQCSNRLAYCIAPQLYDHEPPCTNYIDS